MFLVKALKRGEEVQETIQKELQAQRILRLVKVFNHHTGAFLFADWPGSFLGKTSDILFMEADPGPGPVTELCKCL